MAKRKQRKVAPDVLKNVKANIKELEVNGTESQKSIIRNEFGYIENAARMSEAAVRHAARRLGLGFSTLCQPPKENEIMKKNEKNTESAESRTDNTISLFNAFLSRTGKTAKYAAKILGVSESGLSRARKGSVSGYTAGILNTIRKAMSGMPATEEGIMSANPDALVSMFETASEGLNESSPKELEKKTEADENKISGETKESEKAPENESEKKKTNFEYCLKLAVKDLDGEDADSSAVLDALKSYIPADADTPEKAADWLLAEHTDVYNLGSAETAMLEGYLDRHSNARDTLFSHTYMYEAKAESGLFTDVPGDITLGYLKDHVGGGANG